MEVTCSYVWCANCLTLNLHQIRAVVYASMAAVVDIALPADTDLKLLRLFTVNNSSVNIIHVRKTIYFLSSFIGIFLGGDLTSAYAWICLCRTIMDAGAKVDCHPIINCLHKVITQNSGGDKPYPLVMFWPTAKLVDGYILRQRHNVLI